MILVMLLGARADVMHQFRISLRLKAFGWLATAVMALASTGLLLASL
jgi:Mn2+/Fe2+ NRAMP family transporter